MDFGPLVWFVVSSGRPSFLTRFSRKPPRRWQKRPQQPEATAIDPTAAAASTDTTAGAAVAPPTPGTEPKSPHSLPSVIFRPGRLIEKTLMIEAADGSSVPVPPAIPKRHPLPQPPPAPSSQSSPTPNLGQTRAEREFVLPKPQPVAAVSSEAQFEDYESVVEAARAAIESASQQL